MLSIPTGWCIVAREIDACAPMVVQASTAMRLAIVTVETLVIPSQSVGATAASRPRDRDNGGCILLYCIGKVALLSSNESGKMHVG